MIWEQEGGGLLIYALIWLTLFVMPGIVVGIARSVREIWGISNDRLFGHLEQSSPGRIPLIIFAVTLSYGVFGALLIEGLLEISVEALIFHGILIGIGLVHVGLVRRRGRQKQRFAQIVCALSGAMLGILLGNESGLFETSLLGMSYGVGGFFIGGAIGQYADRAFVRSGFLPHIKFTGSIGSILGGHLGGIVGGFIGGVLLTDAHYKSEIVPAIIAVSIISAFFSGLTGAVFGGLAKPIVHEDTSNIQQKNTLLSIHLLSFFIGVLAVTFTTAYVAINDGSAFSVGGIFPSMGIGVLAGGLVGLISGGIGGGLATAITRAVLFTTRKVSAKVSSILIPFIINQRFEPIICPHCFGASMPLNAGYTDGRRYCEHCGQELEHTPTAGKVVLTFGDFPLTTEGRVFLLANPDFEHVTHHIEISRVYLDTATTDLLVFERFITYILNCPPTLGIHSVKVFYRGSLDALGAHLHNVLQNTFASLQPLPSTPQQSPVTVTQEPNALWLQPRNVWERFLASLKSCRHPVLLLLQHRELFWDRVKSARSLAPVIFSLIPFIVFSCAVYGAVLAGWRSPALSLYVAIKFPILLVGTTGVVAMLNWMLASAFGSGLTFPQVTAITYGAMTVSSWIFLGSAPVTFFFTTYASSATGTHAEIQRTHNYLLLMHILLIAMAGIAGNSALRKGLRRLVAPGCALRRLYWSWLGAFALVGCQLSWILRPFVGSPFYPVVFMRPDCLERNFYEFIFGEVLPYIIKGG